MAGTAAREMIDGVILRQDMQEKVAGGAEELLDAGHAPAAVIRMLMSPELLAEYGHCGTVGFGKAGPECEGQAPGDSEGVFHKVLDACSGGQLGELLAHAAAQDHDAASAPSRLEGNLYTHLLRTAPSLRGWQDVDVSLLFEEQASGRRPLDLLISSCPLRVDLVRSFLWLDVRLVGEFISSIVDRGMVQDIAGCLAALDREHEGAVNVGGDCCPIDRVVAVCRLLLQGGGLSSHRSRGLMQLCDVSCRKAADEAMRGMAKGGRHEVRPSLWASIFAPPQAVPRETDVDGSAGGSNASSGNVRVHHEHLRGHLLDAIGSDDSLQSSVLPHLTLDDVQGAIANLRDHYGARLPTRGVESLKCLVRAAALLSSNCGDGRDEPRLQEEDLIDCLEHIFERASSSLAFGESASCKRARGNQDKVVQRPHILLGMDADLAEQLLSLQAAPSCLAKVLSSKGITLSESGSRSQVALASPGAGLLWVWMFSCVQPPPTTDLHSVASSDWSQSWNKAIKWLFETLYTGSRQTDHSSDCDGASVQNLLFVAKCLELLLASDASTTFSLPSPSDASGSFSQQLKISQMLDCFWSGVCLDFVGSNTMTSTCLESYNSLVDFALICAKYSHSYALSCWNEAGIDMERAQSSNSGLGFASPYRFIDFLVSTLVRRNDMGEKSRSLRNRVASIIKIVCQHYVASILSTPVNALRWPTACIPLVAKDGCLNFASTLVTAFLSGRQDTLSLWINGRDTGSQLSWNAIQNIEKSIIEDVCLAIRAEARGRDVELMAKIILCCIENEADASSLLLKSIDSLRAMIPVADLQYDQVLLYAQAMGSLIESPHLHGSKARISRNIAVRTFVGFFSNDSRETTLRPSLSADPVKYLIVCAHCEGKVRMNALMALAELVGAGSDTIGLGDDESLWHLVDQKLSHTSLVAEIISACTVQSSDVGEGVSGALLFVIALVKHSGTFMSQVVQTSKNGPDQETTSKAFAELLGSFLKHECLAQELEADPDSLLELLPCIATVMQDRQIENHFALQGYLRKLGKLMMHSPLNEMFVREPERAWTYIEHILEAILKRKAGCKQFGDVGGAKWLRCLSLKTQGQTSTLLSKFALRIENAMR